MTFDNGGTALVPAGTVAREEFGARQLMTVTETASSAVAAQAQAAVQARYIVAMQRPRDWDDVRVRLLKECRRPGFAQAARYRKPVGRNGVEGLSIRFAEAALRCMTNVLPETTTIYDDAERRIVRVSVTDLEANLTYTKDIVVAKTVERSSVKEGQEALRVRTNSQGRKTYLVEATDDDLLNKEAALVSKALRQLALRMLPGDIIDEAEDQILATLRDAAAKDPDAERKRIADAFAAIGIQPSDLSLYLGHDLAKVTPAELVDLRAVYQAIRDAETTWQAVLEHKSGKAEAKKTAGGSRSQSLKDRVAAKAAETAPPIDEEEAEAILAAEREPGAEG